jgi:hypothetical protein
MCCTVCLICLLLQFESQVSHAMQQVKGDVHLSVPSNINIDDPEVTRLYNTTYEHDYCCCSTSKILLIA